VAKADRRRRPASVFGREWLVQARGGGVLFAPNPWPRWPATWWSMAGACSVSGGSWSVS